MSRNGKSDLREFADTYHAIELAPALFLAPLLVAVAIYLPFNLAKDMYEIGAVWWAVATATTWIAVLIWLIRDLRAGCASSVDFLLVLAAGSAAAAIAGPLVLEAIAAS